MSDQNRNALARFLNSEKQAFKEPQLNILPFTRDPYSGSWGLGHSSLTESLVNGFKFPGKVLRGEIPLFAEYEDGKVHWSPQMMQGATDTAGLAMTGAIGLPKPQNAIGSGGGGKMADNALPMDQASRMARAKEMGFDTDTVLYHGTSSKNFDAFDATRAGSVQPSDWGDGIYLTPSRSTADYYRTEALKKSNDKYNAALQRYEDLVKNVPVKNGAPQYTDEAMSALAEFQRIGRELDAANGGQIVDALVRLNRPYVQGYQSIPDPGLASRAKASGYDGIHVLDGRGQLDEVVVFDPVNIRSVNAAFDPAKSSSANLLAANPKEGAAVAGAINVGERQANAIGSGGGGKMVPPPAQQPATNAVEQVWGPKFDIAMGQQYRAAEAGGDLSTMYDILTAKLSKASGIDAEMRAAMERKVRSLYDEMQPDGRRAAGIQDQPYFADTLKSYSNPKEGAAVAGAINVGERQANQGIRAYHGSPHDFDRFDMSKIGTGEGAQAYGHGLYFADSEAVAKSYRDKLAGQSTGIKYNGNVYDPPYSPKEWKRFAETEGVDEPLAREILSYFHYTPDAMVADVARFPGTDRDAAILRAAEWRRNNEIAPATGKMYEVNIKANPDDFLDWDKPLSQQSEAVRSVFGRYGIDPSEQGSRAYDLAGAKAAPMPAEDYSWTSFANVINDTTTPMGRVKVADTLRDAGIPGIRYLDQGSRTAGEGSRNYVVFDDALIEILRKYGLLGGSLAGYSAFGQNDPNQ